MKKLLLIAAIMLCAAASIAWFSAGVGGPVQTSAPDYYYGDGTNTDPYSTAHGGLDDTYRLGDRWTPSAGIGITKIGFKVATIYGVTDVKIALWENVSGTWTQRRCGTVSSVSTGWNDLDVSTWTTTTNQIAISVDPSAGIQFYRIGDTSPSTGFYCNPVVYADECTSPSAMSPNDYYKIAVRFYGS